MIRILLVDDEPDLLELERHILEQKYGFSTLTASSGEEALTIFHEKQVDAIISDYSMPKMDGITLLRRIRQENTNIPFILFTIKEKEEIAIEALNSGATFYVQKETLPQIVFAELAHNIHKSVELFRAEKNLKIQRDLALANSQAKSLEETLLLCSRAILDVSGTDGVAIYLNENGQYTLAIISGGSPDYTLERTQGQMAPLINSVAEGHGKLFRDDNQIIATTPGLFHEEGIMSDGFIGMNHHSRNIGVVHIFSHNQKNVLSLSLQGLVADIIVQISGYISDRLADEALRRSENRLSTMIRNLPGMVYQGYIDEERTMDFVSDAASNLTGYKPVDIIHNASRSWASFIHPQDRARSRDVIVQAAQKNARFRLTYRILTRENKYRWVSDQGTGVFDSEGNLRGIEGIVIDITRQKALDDQIRVFHTRLKTLFMLMNTGCLMFRSDGTIGNTILVDMNSAAEEIEQKKKTELIGRSFEEIFSRTDAALKEALVGMLADRKSRSLLKCIRYLDSSTHYFEIFLNIASLGQNRNESEVFLIYNDVTGRVRTEQQIITSLHEKELLLKEVHHRVKNNLQIISGILKLQSLRIQDPRAQEIIQECRNQVYSMASIHELLYNSRDLGKIPGEEYISKLVNHLKQEYEGVSTRLSFELEVDPEIVLDIERCIPCGLILNELIMNAVKYAFEPGGEGIVRVSFIQDQKNYILRVADNGRGLPADFDIRKKESLGMELTNRLAHQLRGEIRISVHNGSTFEVIFPKTEEGRIKI